MAYVRPNYKTKRELRDALASGDHIVVFQPGVGTVPVNGEIDLEGPHSPKPHTWYTTGTMKDGVLVSVK